MQQKWAPEQPAYPSDAAVKYGECSSELEQATLAQEIQD
jgi:hypothetical protein